MQSLSDTLKHARWVYARLVNCSTLFCIRFGLVRLFDPLYLLCNASWHHKHGVALARNFARYRDDVGRMIEPGYSQVYSLNVTRKQRNAERQSWSTSSDTIQIPSYKDNCRSVCQFCILCYSPAELRSCRCCSPRRFTTAGVLQVRLL